MITQAEFTNCMKSLHNIEGWQINGLFGANQWFFMNDPGRFFLGASEPMRAAIWSEIEKQENVRIKLGEEP